MHIFQHSKLFFWQFGYKYLKTPLWGHVLKGGVESWSGVESWRLQIGVGSWRLQNGVESWRLQIGVESWLNIWIEVYFNLQWVSLCPAVHEVAQSHVVTACAKRLSGVERSHGVKVWSRRVEWNFGVIPRPSFNNILEYNKWLKKKVWLKIIGKTKRQKKLFELLNP